MTITTRILLGAGLLALAACDQSGVGGGDNGAAPAAAGTQAEAEADPANTLENQLAELTEGGETGNSAEAANQAEEAGSNEVQANAAGNSQ